MIWYLFGIMKGPERISLVYPLIFRFIHWLILTFIFSSPIISPLILSYPKISFDISNYLQLLFLSYPIISSYLSVDLLLRIHLSPFLSYVISFDLYLLIFWYPKHILPNPWISSYLSRDILPFILLDFWSGSCWSGWLRRVEAVLLLRKQLCFISATPGAGLSRPCDPAAGQVGARRWGRRADKGSAAGQVGARRRSVTTPAPAAATTPGL